MSVVGICNASGTLYGQGMLVQVDGETAAVLTCHHVIINVKKPADLRVVLATAEGLSSPIVARFDEERSSPIEDAAVLRLEIKSPAANPVLQNLNPDFYGGDLPKRAVGFSLKETGTFSGLVGAAIKPVRLEVVRKTFASPLSGLYEFNHAFPLHDTTDARTGISGSPVFYENAAIGLVHFTRAATPDREREAFLVPIKVWSKKWPGLDRLIEPFFDRRFRARAICKEACNIDIEADLTVAGYVAGAYIERAVDSEAKLAGSRPLLIVGKPKSGKTRLAFNVLQSRPDNMVVIPQADTPPDEWERSSLHGRDVTVFFDDLHAKPSLDPLAWLSAMHAAGVRRCSIIATSRDGADLAQVVTSQSLFYERIGGERATVWTSGGNESMQDFSEADSKKLATLLKLDDETRRERFDGTPGSLTLDLTSMRQRYIRMRGTQFGGTGLSRVLDAAKLLRHAFQFVLRLETLRWTCENIRGNKPLSEEEWDALKRHTVDEGFGRFSGDDERFDIYAPYLEQCVEYEPSAAEVKSLLPHLIDDAHAVNGLATSLLFRHGDFAGGRALLERAVQQGTKHSRFELGRFLFFRSQHDAESAKFLREAVAEGDTEAELLLGTVLVNQTGAENECEQLLKRTISRGLKGVQRELARLYERMPGRERDAEKAFKDGIAAEDGPEYIFNDFGAFLSKQKRFTEAEEAFREGCKCGDKLACRNLLRVHLHTERAIADPEAVVQWFTKCADGVDLDMLGGLLLKQGLASLSEKAFTEAIKRGHWESLRGVTALLGITGQNDRLRELISLNFRRFSPQQLRSVASHLFGQDKLRTAAEIVLNSAILSGDQYSKFMLGVLFSSDPERQNEAEAAYRDAIAAGVRQGHTGLGNLLAQDPRRLKEAEKAYRDGIAAGDKGSYAGLMLLLSQDPDRKKEVDELATLAVQRGVIKLQ